MRRREERRAVENRVADTYLWAQFGWRDRTIAMGDSCMRRIGLLVLVAALLATPSLADTMGSITKHVYIDVEPNVTVGALGSDNHTSSGGLGIQTGEFDITVPFRIDANKEQVAIQIEATPLWKGDDPFNNEVAPIELCDYSAVEIDPENANPIQGGDGFPSPTEGGSIINGSRSQRFEAIIFESSQNGHFSQDVDVTVCWDQRDPELPTGEYSGWVKLTAMLIPY